MELHSVTLPKWEVIFARTLNDSGATLEEIVDAVKKVGDIVAEVAAASVEQTSGIDQVNQALTTMDEATQQNAALAEQTSAASGSMSEKASELNDIVTRLQVFSERLGSRIDLPIADVSDWSCLPIIFIAHPCTSPLVSLRGNFFRKDFSPQVIRQQVSIRNALVTIAILGQAFCIVFSYANLRYFVCRTPCPACAE